MNKYKILALVGESGAGKDRLLKEVLKIDKDKILNKIISCTTRPKRDNEVEDADYHYCNIEDFLEHIQDFCEITTFNKWNYGTRYEDLSLEKVNIGVFNKESLEIILSEKNIVCIPVHIYTPPKERLLRALTREQDPNINEIIRRFQADQKDFEDIRDFCPISLYNSTPEDLKIARDNIYYIAEVMNKDGENIHAEKEK